MQGAGVSACAKHFPGKGHAPVDAHLGLPVIDSDWGDMHAQHLPPFLAAIEAGVDCIMTSHPLYPRLDPAPATPATFSRLIVDEYLRTEVGYRGVIVSDDLEMGAVGAVAPIGEAAVRAAAAGHDLLLVCHTESAQRRAHAALFEAHRARALSHRALEQSVARLELLGSKRPRRFEDAPARAERDGDALAQTLADRGTTVIAPTPPGWRRRLDGPVVVVFPRLSSLADRITVEPGMQDEVAYVQHTMRRHGVSPEVEIVGVEPTEQEIARVSAKAAAADASVLFLYDAHLYPSNRALLASLSREATSLAVVLMRDPYDAALLSPGVAGITAYGWRVCQLNAVIAHLTCPS
jgi:beta-N-acetylhexosaminidase